MRKISQLLVPCLAVALIIAGCGPATQEAQGSHSDDPSPAGATEQATQAPTEDPAPPTTAPVAHALDDDHPGWKLQSCAACHSLPVEGHTTDMVWECTACHGSNGAPPMPTSADAVRQHLETDVCAECHLTMHGFEVQEACLGCHAAESS